MRDILAVILSGAKNLWSASRQILRGAQNDSPYLQISAYMALPTFFRGAKESLTEENIIMIGTFKVAN
ncbi:MAG: hypothetical protein ABI465_00755, partial [Ktedonobacteraceae bacterium]